MNPSKDVLRGMSLLRAAIGLAIAMSIASFPAGATAQRLVPPGNSALNQYKETLPGPGGNELREANAPHSSPAKTLGKRNAEKLSELGPEGRAAAELAAATAPARRSVVKHGGGAGAGGSGSSALGEVLGQMTGTSSSGEMGLAFPLVLLATVFGGIAYTVSRRRAS
jgi:hypothetical protein